jgi:microcystin-dependent protein
MAQHDYDIGNSSGLNVRNDLNDAFEATQSLNNGNTAPPTTFPYMLWVDTSGSYPVLKQRNAADSAWINIGRVDQEAFGLNYYYSGTSAPATTQAYMPWVDTSGANPIFKIRNAANSAWITVGRVDVNNFGLLPLTGGAMSGPITYSNTDSTSVPVGTTGQRPGSPTNGMMRGNSTLNVLEGYINSAWRQMTMPHTTKGDMAVHDGTSVGRLPIGSDGQILMADSTQTFGLKWSASSVADGSITLAKLASALQVFLVPTGAFIPFGGTSIPTGFLLCNGQAVSRTTYADLYTAIGTAYGNGDGSTTFNVPDLRGTFLRGHMDVSTVSGSGSASSNNATFTAHGIIRTGMKVRISSGTLTGLSANTDYFAIVVDADTLAFATSYSSAIAGTKISISGTNSAVITQWEDPDQSSRDESASGGNSGASIGSRQQDALQAHKHGMTANLSGNETNSGATSGSGAASSATANLGAGSATQRQLFSRNYSADTSFGSPRLSYETRPSSITSNYIIKT